MTGFWTFEKLLILVFATLLNTGFSSRQYFRVKPVDLEITEGQTIELQCHVGNRAGAVQWSKDGFLLGFQANIPGYPRYKMVTNESRGIFNLIISQVQLEDEGEFQCQVGPAEDMEPIRAKSHLTVLVPPKRLEIRHFANGSQVPIQEEERVTLICRAHESRPASRLKWFRGGDEIRPGGSYHVNEEEKARGRRRTTISTLTLYARLEDQGVSFGCEASHAALKVPLMVSVVISIIHAPSAPEIKGYKDGDVVQVGDKVTLTCTSKGGNPPPTMLWYRGDTVIDRTSTTSDRVTINSYTMTVEQSDNNIVYRCEVQNAVTARPLMATILLKVQYAPSKISITGPSESVIGERVIMTCTSSPSNPPAEIYWIVDGRPIVSMQSVEESAQHGWITSSNVSVVLNRQDPPSKTFTCHASSEKLGETLVKSATLNVLHPPGKPNITGYHEGKRILAGELQRLLCQSSGGNPLAVLTWWKDNVELQGSVSVSASTVTNELLYRVQASDNGATYRCQAINPASPKPIVTSITTHVYFSPQTISMSISPTHPSVGEMVEVFCEVGSSNPQAIIAWLKNDNIMMATSEESTLSEYGGTSTRSILKINVSSNENGAKVTCRASNEFVGSVLEDNLFIEVKFKPRFLVNIPRILNITEGKSAIVNATAIGNPADINYIWYKANNKLKDGSRNEVWDSINRGNEYRTVYKGPILHMLRVTKDDTASYTCEATNSEGSTNVTFLVDVLYPAKIRKMTPSMALLEGETAYFECHVDGHPMNDETVQWKRDGYDMSRTKEVRIRGSSFFTLVNVTRTDTGTFSCVAFNGVGQESVESTNLFVKFVPRLIRDSSPSAVAASSGDTAKLSCLAEGYPPVSFVWSRNGKPIIPDDEELPELLPSRYKINNETLSFISWKTTLTIQDVRPVDLGFYTCVAQNTMGTDHANLKLRERGIPDPPQMLRVLNTTSNSVILTWEPGFNGGETQTFQVIFWEVRSGEVKTIDVNEDANYLIINHLQPSKEYIFSVIARNTYGVSDARRNEFSVKTLGDRASSEANIAVTGGHSSPRSTAVIAVSLISSLLLVCNAILVTCFIRRRKRIALLSKERNVRQIVTSGSNGESLGLSSTETRRTSSNPSFNSATDILPPHFPSPKSPCIRESGLTTAVTTSNHSTAARLQMESTDTSYRQKCLTTEVEYPVNRNYKRNTEREKPKASFAYEENVQLIAENDRLLFELSSDIGKRSGIYSGHAPRTRQGFTEVKEIEPERYHYDNKQRPKPYLEESTSRHHSPRERHTSSGSRSRTVGETTHFLDLNDKD